MTSKRLLAQILTIGLLIALVVACGPPPGTNTTPPVVDGHEETTDDHSDSEYGGDTSHETDDMSHEDEHGEEPDGDMGHEDEHGEEPDSDMGHEGEPSDPHEEDVDDHSDSSEGVPQDTVITLSRTACFGACPVYDVTIFADGTVIYYGHKFVETIGEQKTHIDPTEVAKLVEAFQALDYFSLKDYTNRDWTDMPSAETSITMNGESHTVNHYYGDVNAPDVLHELEAIIDDVASTAQWIGTPSFAGEATPEPDPVMEEEPEPVASTIFVESIVAQVSSTRPNQLNITIAGNLPNPCVEITQVAPAIDHTDIYINIDTMQPSTVVCAQVLAPFERRLAIDITGLEAGDYTIHAGDMTTTVRIDN